MQAIPWEKAGQTWITSLKSLHQITKQTPGRSFLKSVALHKTKQKLSIILSYFKLKLSLVGFNKLIDKPCSLWVISTFCHGKRLFSVISMPVVGMPCEMWLWLQMLVCWIKPIIWIQIHGSVWKRGMRNSDGMKKLIRNHIAGYRYPLNSHINNMVVLILMK